MCVLIATNKKQITFNGLSAFLVELIDELYDTYSNIITGFSK